MKDKERKILYKLNDSYEWDLKEADYEYSRFDAYGESYIVEIKNRKIFYKKVLIEFDKYAFNKEYVKLANSKNKKQISFLYVVGVDNDIYMFNISDLDRNGYDYHWEWIEMPRNTEFKGKGEKIKKIVGYIDIEYIVGRIKDD